jgi:hypothetical protein
LYASGRSTNSAYRKVLVCTGVCTHRRLPRLGLRLYRPRHNPRYPSDATHLLIPSDTKDFLLRDHENEAKYGTKLEQTVARARENNRQLFKPYQIYIASNVPGLASLRRIVEANGGEARAVSNTIKGRAKILRSDYLRTVDQILVCSDLSDDAALRGKFEEEVREGGVQWGMYTSEWIMRSVLKQEIAKDAGLSLT